MYIRDLPLPLQKLAKIRIQEYFDRNGEHFTYHEPDGVLDLDLDLAFYWTATPEGYRFWKGVKIGEFTMETLVMDAVPKSIFKNL